MEYRSKNRYLLISPIRTNRFKILNVIRRVKVKESVWPSQDMAAAS